jgi:hypothetical protein
MKVPVTDLSPEEAPAHFGWLNAFAGILLVLIVVVLRPRLGMAPFC